MRASRIVDGACPESGAQVFRGLRLLLLIRGSRDGEPPTFVNISNMLPFKRLDLLIDAFADLRQSHDARLLILVKDRRGTRLPSKSGDWALTPVPRSLGGSMTRSISRPTHGHWCIPRRGRIRAGADRSRIGSGCPVIAADAKGGGPRFVTDNGTYGLLVPKGDRPKLAEAMTCMLRPEIHKCYFQLGMQRADALSPIASATTLVNFLSMHLGMNA